MYFSRLLNEFFQIEAKNSSPCAGLHCSSDLLLIFDLFSFFSFFLSSPLSLFYLCMLLFNFLAKHLFHLLLHLLNLIAKTQIWGGRFDLEQHVTFNLCLEVSSSMTASGFLFGIVGLPSSIAAKELSSLHLKLDVTYIQKEIRFVFWNHPKWLWRRYWASFHFTWLVNCPT